MLSFELFTPSVIVIIVIIAPISSSSSKVQWCYSKHGDCGPSNWHYNYVDCKGKDQSPVNINVTEADYFSKLSKLQFNNLAVLPKYATLSNNGHSVQITPHYKRDHTPQMFDASACRTYTLAQYHFHWAGEDGQGSEHTIDGQRFPAELHFVFYDRKYGSISAAVSHKEGLAVIAVMFFMHDGESNEHIDYITSYFKKIERAETSTIVRRAPPMQVLLPINMHRYYSYRGSLTTPGCNEVVLWTVLDQYMTITKQQLHKLQSLKDSKGKPLEGNFRPTQPLNDRKIYRSFQL